MEERRPPIISQLVELLTVGNGAILTEDEDVESVFGRNLSS